jgi:hypothetical protein
VNAFGGGAHDRMYAKSSDDVRESRSRYYTVRLFRFYQVVFTGRFISNHQRDFLSGADGTAEGSFGLDKKVPH